MEEAITLIEGMKKLRVIEKRIADNQAKIQEYSSKLSNEKYIFDSEKEQKEKIKSLAQANEDLANEYYLIHARVTLTNLKTKVQFKNREYTIHEMILYRRKLADLVIKTYHAMNEKNGEAKIARRTMDNTITIERMYNENEKMQKLSFWQDMLDSIDGRLETINATTDLMEL